MVFKRYISVFRALRFFIIIQLIDAATIAQMKELHKSLFGGYNKTVRPVTDQSSTIDVYVYMYVKSIREFDEAAGKFSFVAALTLRWTDEKLLWDKTTNGGIEEITVSHDDVWVPEIELSSPSSTGSIFRKSSDRVRVDQNGTMEWIPGGLIESTCNVNAKKFPFDTQSCDTNFTSIGYRSYEVTFHAGFQKINLTEYIGDSLWDVTGSEVEPVILTGSVSEIKFTMHLKRDATFAVINIMVPIFILSLLNVLVFLLVPESGERIGYCITTLLAIAVYMTIVNDLLPKTSRPVPLISYKLMIDLIMSALIVCVTIVNMRLYRRDDKVIVPGWLKSVYRFLICTRSRIHPDKTAEEKPKGAIGSTKSKKIEENAAKYKRKGSVDELRKIDEENNPITWKKISYMIDWIAFFAFLFMSVMNMIIFIGIAKS
ncbi:acetylcholine receptor subunit beta-type acr-3-like [Ruditapes philippinarum]|uniref:acetylcholine receptor subunit beta-type acr-3-like n=1 Tax=Ruditapes philippinarum TaxID=129788 RepID=UPI00295B5441|nr:acetylcholine receptor subunit beta-type acr-3-like [Ruditapes philippinarum]